MDRSRRTERLESRWTDVRGLSMHARVAADLAAPDPPEVVLVHGVGIADLVEKRVEVGQG
jgi:hypothetical protein